MTRYTVNVSIAAEVSGIATVSVLRSVYRLERRLLSVKSIPSVKSCYLDRCMNTRNGVIAIRTKRLRRVTQRDRLRSTQKVRRPNGGGVVSNAPAIRLFLLFTTINFLRSTVFRAHRSPQTSLYTASFADLAATKTGETYTYSTTYLYFHTRVLHRRDRTM